MLAALSTPLAAQSGGAIGLGFVATLGGRWQIESGELGYVRRLSGGPLRAVAAGVRLGAFVDDNSIIGGARGFVAAATVSARTGRAVIAELGDEQNVTGVGLDLTVEVTGYVAANSPLPQGSRWGAVAILPGVRAGGRTGPQYGVLIGPTAFLGSKTEVRTLIAFRIETPLARREPHP